MKPREEISVEEYRRLQKPARKATRPRKASIPTAAPEPRTPAGWAADYDRAGSLGWQFGQDAHTCYAWRPATGERTARYPLQVYASAAGTLRAAVVAALAAEGATE